MDRKPTVEELLTSTLEALDGLLCVIDRNHRIILSNWKAHQWITEEEKRQPSYCYKVFKNLDAPCDYCPPVDTFNDGKPRTYEDRNPIDGSFKEIRVIPIFDDRGEVVNVIEYVQDITKRKQAEELLKLTQEKFSGAFHYSNDAIVLCDLQGKIIDVNQQALSQFARTRDEFLALTIFDLHPGVERDAAKAILAEVINNKYARYEIDIVNKRERVYHAEISSSLFEIADQQIVQFVIRDVTKRKQVEEALKKSEKEYREVFESYLDIYFETDLKGKILTVTPSVKEIVGYDAAELVGQTVFDVYSDATVADEITFRLTDQGRVNNFEVELNKKDGQTIVVSVNANLVHKGDLSVVKGTVRDITHQKKLETERKELESQLARRHKMEALGFLAGGVAHDLNNKLSAIVSYPDLFLYKLPEESPLREPMMTIKRSGEEAAAIVQDLLTLARRGVTAVEIVNLNTVITEYLGSIEFKKLSERRVDVQVKSRLSKRLLNIAGSPVHLSKSLANLVRNAFEAIPLNASPAKLFISTENRSIDQKKRGYDHIKEGDYVVVTVTDSGDGIATRDLERIFEPFYTSKRMGRSGTGLGMSVIWGTVKDHNGYIDVKSKRGKGTTFKLYFPITRAQVTEECTELRNKRIHGQGERIMVVDDIAAQREIAQTILRELGYRVITATCGREAVSYLKNNPVDLLMLDMIMPQMDGLETYKEVLKIHPRQKAVVVSGFAETKNVKQAQKLGAGPYIKKPYLIEQIGSAIRKELDR